MKGTLCISLDFEKFWGIHDVVNLKNKDENLTKVSKIIDRLLVLFQTYNIQCTWAVVGALNFKTINELEVYCNNITIQYTNSKFSPFPIEKHKIKTTNPQVMISSTEIEKIKQTADQEIASHTFSHLYCLEKGLTAEDFKQDIHHFKEIVGEVNSIVFPRNQVNKNYLDQLANGKTIAYRGNQNNKFWANSDFKTESIFKKIGRFLDAYIKISKDNLVDWNDLKPNQTINIPASRFLRPYQFNSSIEKLKIKRIKNQMTAAAKKNKIYHLWWHPHNYSTNTEENFKQLETLLEHFLKLKKQYNFQSLNMNEISKAIV